MSTEELLKPLENIAKILQETSKKISKTVEELKKMSEMPTPKPKPAEEILSTSPGTSERTGLTTFTKPVPLRELEKRK